MKVCELIQALQSMPQQAEVYSYCDHGQMPERSGKPTVMYSCEPLTYTLDEGIYSQEDIEDCGFTVEELHEFVML